MSHSELASASATIAVLQRHGLYTKKSLGQHFLVDDNVVGRIMALAGVGPDDIVLEVGPGIGTLTLALCAVARRVVAVETDQALAPVLAQTTAGCRCQIGIVMADAATVAPDALTTPDGPPGVMVANLPYAVAATVVLRSFEILPSLTSATIMVQAEVAERMAASPGTKAYGAYTVKLQLLARPAGRFKVARGSFLPPPRVDSAVIRLERVARPGLTADDLTITARTVEAAFCQRRKTLRNSLAAGLRVSTAQAEAAIVGAGFDPGVRAEALDVDQHVTLARSVRSQGLV